MCLHTYMCVCVHVCEFRCVSSSACMLIILRRCLRSITPQYLPDLSLISSVSCQGHTCRKSSCLQLYAVSDRVHLSSSVCTHPCASFIARAEAWSRPSAMLSFPDPAALANSRDTIVHTAGHAELERHEDDLQAGRLLSSGVRTAVTGVYDCRCIVKCI